MGYGDEDGWFIGEQLQQNFADNFAIFGIEVTGRFIGQNEGRFEQQGACDGDALALSTRQFAGSMIEAIGQSDPLQQHVGAFEQFGGGWRLAGQERHQHVLPDIELRQQVVILEDESDLLIPNRANASGRGQTG